METRDPSALADSGSDAGRLTLWDLLLGLALAAALCCVGCAGPSLQDTAQDSAPTWLDHDAAEQLDGRFYEIEAAVAQLERQQHLAQLEPAPPMRSATWPAEDDAATNEDPEGLSWWDALQLALTVVGAGGVGLGTWGLVGARSRQHLGLAARALAAVAGWIHTDSVNKRRPPTGA